jgi:hypothetical protein
MDGCSSANCGRKRHSLFDSVPFWRGWNVVIITVCKDAIAHNMKHGWVGKQRRNPVRVMKAQNDAKPVYANVVDICDASGNVVAAVVSSRDGKPIAEFGTHVVIFTSYPAKVKA